MRKSAASEALGKIRETAQERLEKEVWHYLCEGEDTGHERAFAETRLIPRPLRDLGDGHTRCTILGENLEHPIILAPVAYQRIFHPEGEVGSVIAASAQGGQSAISTLASQPFFAIARAAQQGGGLPPWFQLYWQGSRDKTLRLLERAKSAGMSTVIFTVDAPIKPASLVLPKGVNAVNLEPEQERKPSLDRVFNGLITEAPTWEDLSWLRERCPGQLLIKGVIHPDDAEQAVHAGCDGIVVSSHGGRVLPGCAISLHALPTIVQRLRSISGIRPAILFDSGIRSGIDIFIALALGANAVLIGRPYLWGLAAKGALGVANVIRVLRDELEMTMALTGCATISEIGPNCIFRR